MAKLKDKVVLITGGAAGIGLCTAENFAKAGCKLVLTDIKAGALEAAKNKLAKYQTHVEGHVVNVADRQEVEALAADDNNRLGGVDVLITNAGVGYMGELAETDLSTWEKLMGVNFWGPLYHIYAFLPQMKKRGGGAIVNISSGQAFLQLPTWGAYASIKAGLGVYSEVLHWELAKYNIKVTTVYPYMVNTGLYNDVKADTWLGKLSMKAVPYYSQSPEHVARIIFKAVKKGVRVEMVSVFNEMFKAAKFISPIGNTVSWMSSRFLTKNAGAAPATKG